MSRKTETVATFAVKIKIPKGMNLQQMQQAIRSSLETSNVPKEDFTVALMKKETRYGNS